MLLLFILIHKYLTIYDFSSMIWSIVGMHSFFLFWNYGRYAFGYGLPKYFLFMWVYPNIVIHVGMGILVDIVLYGRCGYGTALPNGYIPVAI